MSKKIHAVPHYRLWVLARVFIAVVGGYAFATAAILLLTHLFPFAKKESLMLATMLSYIIYALAIIWVFSVKTVKRAGVVMLVSTGTMAALAFLLQSLQQTGH